MKKMVQLRSLAIMVVILLAVGVQAQGALGQKAIEQIRVQLERTDQLIDQASQTVLNSGQSAAMAALDQAKAVQQRAWDQFSMGTQAGYLAAQALTRQARSLIKDALKLIGSTGSNSEQQDGFVLRRLERADDLMDQAKETLASGEDQNFSTLLDAARENLNRAWEFYRNKQYRPAVALADQVERTLQKIIQSAGLVNRAKENYERRKENVDRLLDQFRQMLADCGSETAKAFMQQADKALELADQLCAGQRYWAASQVLQQARELGVKAARECQGTEMLQLRHDKLLTRIEQLRQSGASLPDAQKESLTRLLNEAEKQLDLASQGLTESNWEKATLALQAAQLAIRQAEGLVP